LKKFSTNVDFLHRVCYNEENGGNVMEYLVDLGKRIRFLRIQKQLTQEQLAFIVGYTSRSSINKIEKGLVDIPQSKIAEFANALGVTPAYILFGNDEPKESTPTEPKLSEGEQMLLNLFRKLPQEAQVSYIERLEEALKTLGLI
jgi:transcriptional regulator with XRE-family HTH domain